MNDATQFFDTVAGGPGPGPGYPLGRSLRFNSADLAYLSRNLSTSGNTRTFTWSGWVKRGRAGGGRVLMGAGKFSPNNQSYLSFTSDSLRFFHYNGTAVVSNVTSTAVFRDFSAWMHVVLAVDTTQAAPTNRVRIYVNGSQITSFSTATYPLGMDTFYINNSAYLQSIGDMAGYSVGIFPYDGYLADIHFIDGQALTPSSFGEFDTNGVWQPKAYAGTYGTNGFHLPFSNNSTAAALGTDTSGNGNTWTVNNLSVAAGAGNDSLVDSPTNYGTDTGAGGEVRGNYATWNPLDNVGNTLSNGNLDSLSTAAGISKGTFAVSSGKWYWEVTKNANNTSIGIALFTVSPSISYLGFGQTWSYYSLNGYLYTNGLGSAYGATYTNGDVIGVALDLDNDTLTFYKNGVSQGTAATGLTGTYVPAVGNDQNGPSVSANFGQRPFAYTAPSGFKALCTTNLPEPTIADGSTAMDVALWAGNNSTQTISGLGFSPDLVWIKSRSDPYNHMWFDTVRGAGNWLRSNSNNAQSTQATSLTSFNSDGFSLGGYFLANSSGDTYAGWTWDAGSSTVTNTQGSITSQVRANASAGFSVVTYTGTGTANSTFGHGLGVAPALIITKNRGSANDWYVYHSSLGVSSYLSLNLTAAAGTLSNYWGPVNSTVFGQPYAAAGPNNGLQVAYCFAPVAGYSSFGSYTGNGNANGPFVYTGFRPRWVMFKCLASTTGNEHWVIKDTLRTAYNPTDANLYANRDVAEDYTSTVYVDLVSNGFKIRGTYAGINSNTATYIYAAFAEHPFATSRAR